MNKIVRNPNLPPIREIYGTLAGVEIDPPNGRGYLVIEYDKRNRYALQQTTEELKDWQDRDIYIQVRLMTKTRSKEKPDTDCR